MKKRFINVSFLLKMILAAMLLLFSTGLYASVDIYPDRNYMSEAQQKRVVRGVVVDESGEPVAGANVVVKGTTIGIITDMDGAFTLEASADAVLQISYVGYLAQDITAVSSNLGNIVLSEDSQIGRASCRERV